MTLTRSEWLTVLFLVILATCGYYYKLLWLTIIASFSAFFVVPFVRSLIEDRILIIIKRIMHEDYRYWFSKKRYNYRKELDLIGSSVLDRVEIATFFKDHRCLKTSDSSRLKIKFEDICVQASVRAHILFNKQPLRLKIIDEIENTVTGADVDIILLSDSLANNLLKSSLEERFEANVFSYSLKDDEVSLISPDALFLGKTEIESLKVMVVEAALFSPRIIYRLQRYLKKLSEGYDKNVEISNLIIVFASKNKSFYKMQDIKSHILVEINSGIRAGGSCVDCHLGDCKSEPEISKSYAIC